MALIEPLFLKTLGIYRSVGKIKGVSGENQRGQASLLQGRDAKQGAKQRGQDYLLQRNVKEMTRKKGMRIVLRNRGPWKNSD